MLVGEGIAKNTDDPYCAGVSFSEYSFDVHPVNVVNVTSSWNVPADADTNTPPPRPVLAVQVSN